MAPSEHRQHKSESVQHFLHDAELEPDTLLVDPPKVGANAFAEQSTLIFAVSMYCSDTLKFMIICLKRSPFIVMCLLDNLGEPSIKGTLSVYSLMLELCPTNPPNS
eukprot:1077038-Amphidinium_carterae.3